MNGEWNLQRILRVGRTPIIFAIVLLLLWFGYTMGKKMWETPLPGPATDPCVVKQQKELESKDVVVRVYNGGTRRGTASVMATQLRQAGFTIQDIDNTDERIVVAKIRTYNPEAPEIKLITGFLPDAEIEKVDRKSAIVDVMVGNDAKSISFNAKAPKKIVLKSGSACIQPVTKPSASASPTP